MLQAYVAERRPEIFPTVARCERKPLIIFSELRISARGPPQS